MKKEFSRKYDERFAISSLPRRAGRRRRSISTDSRAGKNLICSNLTSAVTSCFHYSPAIVVSKTHLATFSGLWKSPCGSQAVPHKPLKSMFDYSLSCMLFNMMPQMVRYTKPPGNPLLDRVWKGQAFSKLTWQLIGWTISLSSSDNLNPSQSF